jgi:hypothetical protein
VSYEAVYIGAFPAFAEDHLPTALRWAAQKLDELGLGLGELSVVAPGRDSFGRSGPLSSLPRGTHQATWKSLHPLGAVVIAAWPNLRAIEKIEERAYRLRAMCVLPWGPADQLDPWIAARGATDLLGSADRPAPGITDPVVETALRSLTLSVNLSTGLGNPRDRASAVWAFRALKRARHAWDPAEIHAWAMANGWRAEDARELRTVAEGVAAGKAYKVGPSPWRSDIVDVWSAEAQGSNG